MCLTTALSVPTAQSPFGQLAFFWPFAKVNETKNE